MSALKFRSIYSASIDSAESQSDFSNAPQSQTKSWKVVETAPEAAAAQNENSDGTKDDSFDDQKG
jgi:hypothetical protein